METTATDRPTVCGTVCAVGYIHTAEGLVVAGSEAQLKCPDFRNN